MRLFEEIREAGYEGRLRLGEALRVRDAAPAAARSGQAVRDPSGYQGLVDFAEFRTPWGKRHALVVVLGYSRLMWVRY